MDVDDVVLGIKDKGTIEAVKGKVFRIPVLVKEVTVGNDEANPVNYIDIEDFVIDVNI